MWPVMKHIDMRCLTPAAQEERRRQVIGLREPELWISLDLLAFQRDGRLAGSVGIGDEAGQDMDHGVHEGSVAGMLKAHVALEDIEHGLDDEALAQHDLVPSSAIPPAAPVEPWPASPS